MDYTYLIYDLTCIVTSCMMAVLAADRKDIPCRWFVVYVTGVASVTWRCFRLTKTWNNDSVRGDHPLFLHDLALSTTGVLLGWYMCRETRVAVTAVMVLMVFGLVLDGLKFKKLSCLPHTFGHILLVVILAAYSRVAVSSS